MNNKDFDIFKQNVNWFLKPVDEIKLAASKINFSDRFISTFSVLYKLVSQATIGNAYRQSEFYFYKIRMYKRPGKLDGILRSSLRGR